MEAGWKLYENFELYATKQWLLIEFETAKRSPLTAQMASAIFCSC